MTKHETICITRCGFNFLHGERVDCAAKVTYLRYEPGSIYDPREGVRCEMLILPPNPWTNQMVGS